MEVIIANILRMIEVCLEGFRLIFFLRKYSMIAAIAIIITIPTVAIMEASVPPIP